VNRKIHRIFRYPIPAADTNSPPAFRILPAGLRPIKAAGARWLNTETANAWHFWRPMAAFNQKIIEALAAGRALRAVS
jgi:hypothetical protein